MSLMLKNCISYGVLAIGLLIYCCCINAYQFVESTIVMLLTILTWVTLTTFLELFDRSLFSRVLSITGLIFAISFFFFFGIEEVPVPKGAILFNAQGIAITLFIIFMSALPTLYIIHEDSNPKTANTQSSYLPSNKAVDEDIDDDWEIATDEDIESGNFEVAA